jgi:hypothetical protein
MADTTSAATMMNIRVTATLHPRVAVSKEKTADASSASMATELDCGKQPIKFLSSCKSAVK